MPAQLNLPLEEEGEDEEIGGEENADMENHVGDRGDLNDVEEEVEEIRNNGEWGRAAGRVVPWLEQQQVQAEGFFDPFQQDPRAGALAIREDLLPPVPHEGLALNNLNDNQWAMMNPQEREIIMRALGGFVEDEGLMLLSSHHSVVFFLSPDRLRWLCTSLRCRAQAGQDWTLHRVHTVALRSIDQRIRCIGCGLFPQFTGGAAFCYDCAWTVLVHPEHIRAGRILRTLPRTLDNGLPGHNRLAEPENLQFPAILPPGVRQNIPATLADGSSLNYRREYWLILMNGLLLATAILCCLVAFLFVSFSK